MLFVKEINMIYVIFIILSVKIYFKNRQFRIFMEMARAKKMPKMAIGCHSNGSANFEEKTLIHQIIHQTESSDQIS